MNFYDVQFQMSEEDKMENDYGYAARAQSEEYREMVKNQGTARVEPSNVESALMQMEETINNLQDNIDRMHKKMEPVLNDFPVPCDDEPSATQDRAPYSPVVHSLVGLNERLKNLCNRVNTLTYRLDV